MTATSDCTQARVWTYYNELSISMVTLPVRYKFNALKNKHKGTGAGQRQKSRM